jgi:hypothetical protein
MTAPTTVEDRPTRSVELISPGLAAAHGLGDAFELKFKLTPQHAADLEAWARSHLTPDSHGDNGCYRITSVYCDTPHLDVFHRSPRFRRSKFRLRRYDGSSRIFLERKTKRGDRVRKLRCEIEDHHLPWLNGAVAPADWAGVWFMQRIRQRKLQPTACVSYRRTAFFGMDGGVPVRMTLDRDLVGIPASQWQVPHITSGHKLLPDAVLLELKFHVTLPPIFRELLQRLPNEPARASKYRRSVELSGLAGMIPQTKGAATPISSVNSSPAVQESA